MLLFYFATLIFILFNTQKAYSIIKKERKKENISNLKKICVTKFTNFIATYVKRKL